MFRAVETTRDAPLSLAAFDYVLPPELIARYPLAQREASRMLVLDRRTGHITHAAFTDIARILSPGDRLVMNNTRVLPVRLIGNRRGHTAPVELLLQHPLNADKTQWQVLMRPARRLSPGTQVDFEAGPLTATIVSRLEAGHGVVQLDWPVEYTLDTLLETIGKTPIPPYLMREAEALDRERYQTVYAKHPGAQAAPTAGLHFTEPLLASLKQQGIVTSEVTLHVSAGTFRPVLTDNVADHRMDPEYYDVPAEAAQEITRTQADGGRVICVGTTSLKTLETVAAKHQGKVVPAQGWSDLFIRPRFSFQVAAGPLTNFHLPKSTLLMLVSAFADPTLIRQAYAEAIAQRYRFYSYGDCMLIL